MTIRKLPGSQIESNTITITQIQTTAVTNIVAQAGPRVSSLIYPGNDTAGNTVGGQTVYINGSGFETNNAIYINGNAVPSKSFISASNLSFTTPALAAGIYPVYLINTDSGATAIFVPGYISSAEPTWVTSAGSLSESQDELTAWSYSLSATGDAPITYALAAGSSLPTGVSLAANGLISGTISSPSGNTTTYTFSVVATDAQNQDSTRQFTVTTTTGEGVLFANNVLLIHADGTNNQNNHTFLDSSNNNFTITRNGNATQGTFSPFSQTGWSAYFDGTGDYLNTSNNAAFTFGTGDLTIEGWIYQTATSASTYRVIFGDNVYGSTGGYTLYSYNNALNLWKGSGGGGAEVIAPAGTIPLNAWTHVAWTRSGSSNRLFINGTQVGATTTDSTNYTSTASFIGASQSGSLPFAGYISNVRILKGTAQYTSNFTPSTTPLTNIANTSLLTLQSNRFIDNSNNNFAITRNGDVSIQAFSPFAPTAAYSAANVGGSVYLDGTGDYLSAPNHSNLDLSSGDFTVECWFYISSTPSVSRPILGRIASNVLDRTYLQYLISYTSAGSVVITPYSSTSNYDMVFASVSLNSWHHVALVRSGNSFYAYLDGNRNATTQTISGNLNTGSWLTYLGVYTEGGTSYFNNGYISDARIIKGTALYTGSTYTVPTAPLTNIANTSLLCNFTNAGIFDQTAKNILETVGDAKVSTAQYKYGTGSIALDGTGDYVVVPTNVNFGYGTGDFTIEYWVYFNSVATDQTIVSHLTSASSVNPHLYLLGSGSSTLRYYTNNADRIVSSALSTNTWYHVALSRASGSTKLFINGTQSGSTYADTNNYGASAPLGVGTYWSSGAPVTTSTLNGYIDDLRITKGYARYTSNFTAPTAALKDK